MNQQALFKRVTMQVIITITLATAIIIILAWLSQNDVDHDNGFNRIILYSTEKIASIKKDPSLWNFSGEDDSNYYYQGKDPRFIIFSSHRLEKLDTITVDFPHDVYVSSHFQHIIDSAYIWLIAKNLPGIFVYDRRSKKIQKLVSPNAIFTRFCKVSNSTYIVRGFDTTLTTPDQIFIKLDNINLTTKRETGISKSEGDNGIATDGLLHYDSLGKQLIYVPFYRNELLYIDTNLNNLKKSTTLDTVSVGKIKTGLVSSNGVKGYNSIGPKQVINSANSVSNGLLYNLSQLRADNESRDVFRNNSVIDIYDLRKQAYQGSIHIPDYNGEKLILFSVVNDKLIGIYKSYIVTYKLLL